MTRLSALPGSPYYDREKALRARVLVDGVEARDVIEANEEEGWAEVVMRERDGPRRVYGVVQIII